MTRATIYCVQPFWSDGRRLAHGTLRQYSDRARALRAGQVAAGRNSGVIVYSVEGDPLYEQWERPREIARFGDVPAIRF